MLSSENPEELAIRFRQGIPLQNNFVDLEATQKKRALDDFFLYTSISGLRFLHSRNPKWFQLISAVALILSAFMSIYHSWTFILKFLQPIHTAQMTASYYSEVDTPILIICPYRQFK
jgi:hypothetical protein